MISENSVVRARINEQVKDEAAAVLGAMGLTVSDAFRMMMVRIATEKALPFAPLVPNAKTVSAMKAARRGELVAAGKPGKLLVIVCEGRGQLTVGVGLLLKRCSHLFCGANGICACNEAARRLFLTLRSVISACASLAGSPDC
jgi:DNA-damage-inducible protein J